MPMSNATSGTDDDEALFCDVVIYLGECIPALTCNAACSTPARPCQTLPLLPQPALLPLQALMTDSPPHLTPCLLHRARSWVPKRAEDVYARHDHQFGLRVAQRGSSLLEAVPHHPKQTLMRPRVALPPSSCRAPCRARVAALVLAPTAAHAATHTVRPCSVRSPHFLLLPFGPCPQMRVINSVSPLLKGIKLSKVRTVTHVRSFLGTQPPLSCADRGPA